MCLLVNNIHAKNLTCFSSFTCHRLSKLPQFPHTINKIPAAILEICLLRTQAFLSFYVFNFSCFSTASTERNTPANTIPLHCCALFLWVLIEESVATVVSSIAIFVVHAGFYSRVTEKTKSF